MVAVAVAAVEGDQHVRAELLDAGANLVADAVERLADEGAGVGGAGHPGVGEAEQLNPGHPEQLPPPGAARVHGRRRAARARRRCRGPAGRRSPRVAHTPQVTAPAARRVQQQRAAPERLVVGVGHDDQQPWRLPGAGHVARTEPLDGGDDLLGHLEHREVAAGVEPAHAEPGVLGGVRRWAAQHCVVGGLGVQVQGRARHVQRARERPAGSPRLANAPRSHGRRDASAGSRSWLMLGDVLVQRAGTSTSVVHIWNSAARTDCHEAAVLQRRRGRRRTPAAARAPSSRARTIAGTRWAPRRRRSSIASQPACDRPTGTTCSSRSAADEGDGVVDDSRGARSRRRCARRRRGRAGRSTTARAVRGDAAAAAGRRPSGRRTSRAGTAGPARRCRCRRSCSWAGSSPSWPGPPPGYCPVQYRRRSRHCPGHYVKVTSWAGRTTTSYAVLGLLSVRTWTTYELAKQVRRRLHWFWPRAERKLYDEPKRLVAAGLATASGSATASGHGRCTGSRRPAGSAARVALRPLHRAAWSSPPWSRCSSRTPVRSHSSPPPWSRCGRGPRPPGCLGRAGIDTSTAVSAARAPQRSRAQAASPAGNRRPALGQVGQGAGRAVGQHVRTRRVGLRRRPGGHRQGWPVNVRREGRFGRDLGWWAGRARCAPGIPPSRP